MWPSPVSGDQRTIDLPERQNTELLKIIGDLKEELPALRAAMERHPTEQAQQ